MTRNRCFALLAVLLLLGLTGCGKKEEPAATETTAAEPAKPEVKPGEMVLIPAGEFIMGSNEDKSSSAYPEHKVNLPAFWIDKYEVTNSEFLQFSIDKNYPGEGAAEGKDWRKFLSPTTAKNPVVYITWNDAKAYCEAQGKRLPTEEEWEKAARGANGFRYPWGEKWEAGKSNVYEAGLRQPGEIGQHDDVSPYGVHDLLGNVQEWTASWYKAYKGNVRGDINFGERFRVVRGASSRIYGSRFHLWDRSAYVAGAFYDFGLRCAKNVTPEEAAKAAAAPAK